MALELQRVVEHIQQTIGGLATAKLEEEYEYSCVPLCIIDAVFSIGVRYESTRNTVSRFCDKYGWEMSRSKAAIERRVSELVDILRPFEGQFETANIFGNRQRTSSRSGKTKAEAVYRFAKILEDHNIQTLTDAFQQGNNAEIKNGIRQIWGQASGISFSYFLILVGHRDIVKPDRMIRGFVANALGKPSVSQDYAEEMIISASKQLNTQFPNLTAAILDNAIWKYQRDYTDALRASGTVISGKTTPLNAVELYEMSNFFPETTGLPMTIWVSPRGRASHDLRIKVSMTRGTPGNHDDVAVVAARPSPHLIRGHLSADDMDAVSNWVTLNSAALIAYWDGETDTGQMVHALQRLHAAP